MIKPAALVMAVAMGAVSAGTYFGLDLLPPGLLPEPLGRTQKPEPPKPGTSPAFAQQPAAETAQAAAPVAAPAPAEQPMTEQDLAEEPPPPAPAAEPAPAPQTQVAAAEPEPAPAPQPAKPAYKPAPALVDVIPESKPAPKKQPAAEAARESQATGDGTEVAKAEPAEAPKSAKKAPPEADVIKPWWPDSSKLPANQLKLQYAGQVQGEQAIALLFSAPLNVDSLRQHAQVKTETGQPVSGAWELGKNPRLAVFRGGVDSGRYTVILAPQIADTKGFMLGQTLKGPVYIQQQQ